MTADLQTIEGRPALRFERYLPHSVERVWRAVSEPAEVRRWMPAAADWTPELGETFELGGRSRRPGWNGDVDRSRVLVDQQDPERVARPDGPGFHIQRACRIETYAHQLRVGF